MATAPSATLAFLSSLRSKAESEFSAAIEDLRSAQTRSLTAVAQAYQAEEQRLTQHYQQVLYTLEELGEDWESPGISRELRSLVGKQTAERSDFPAILRAFTIDCDLELTEVVAKSCFRGEAPFPQYLHTLLSPTLQPLAHSKQLRLINSLSPSSHFPDLQFAYHQCCLPLSPASAEIQTLTSTLQTNLQTAFQVRRNRLISLFTEDSESMVAFTKRQMRTAKDLWEAGKATEAVSLVEKLAGWLKTVSRSRSTAEIFVKLADSYEEVEENFEAVEALYRESLEIVEELHGNESEMAELLHQWGRKLISFGKVPEAKTVLRKALGLAPRNEGIFDSLSSLTRDQAVTVPAKKPQLQVSPAVQVDQSAGLRHLKAAEIYLEIDDKEQAEARLQAALAAFQLPHSPSTLIAFRLLTTLYVSQGRIAEAETVLGMWLEAANNVAVQVAEVYQATGELLLQTGQLAAAEENVRFGLQQIQGEEGISPAICGLYRTLGDICKEQGRWEEALASFNQAYAYLYAVSPNSPDFAPIWLSMAFIYHQQSDLVEEEHCCKLAVDHLMHFHPSSKLLSTALKALIQTYMLQSKHQEAEAAYDELAKILNRPDETEFSEIWVARAGLNRLLDRDDLAKSFLFTAFTSSVLLKNEVSVREILTELETLDYRKDLISLESCYISIINSFGPEPSPLLQLCYEHMGKSQLNRGDFQGAFTNLTSALMMLQKVTAETWSNVELMKWIAIANMKLKRPMDGVVKELTEMLGRLKAENRLEEALKEVIEESERMGSTNTTQFLQELIVSQAK